MTPSPPGSPKIANSTSPTPTFGFPELKRNPQHPSRSPVGIPANLGPNPSDFDYFSFAADIVVEIPPEVVNVWQDKSPTAVIDEIGRVRSSLFQVDGVKKEPLVLPDPEGEPMTLTEKVYVPVKDHPDFNFVGRILGPRGMTAKQLELETGCKIMVRGKGSMRDKKKEEASRGKPNWEHLNEDLHVLITVEDSENRAKARLARAVEEVKNLIVPAEGEDELKKRQLMELAIINGTYRDSNTKALAAADEEWRRMTLAAACVAETQRLMSPGLQTLTSPLRTGPTPTPLGAPLILSPRLSVPTTAPQLLSPPEAHPQLIYAAPYAAAAAAAADYNNYAALAGTPLISEYPTADHSG
ncbi:Hypothetical protein NTJ_04644 [Nesidiocoris tenuis]|uniref:K Homology domain-containing protein n=1 Tax=Nesidiocoris tenuis TaxID=355587 RepID=A0ABN7AHU4_9HEMI|nr:Hypothetical protein NTJ_04644 [Nesidiocoris tenuis]